MSPRNRVAIFLGLVVLVTGIIQWNGFGAFLDSLAGLEWSSALVAYLRQNTQGLFVFVLLGIFLEWSGIRQSAEGERKELRLTQQLLDEAMATSPGRALMKRGFALTYGDEAADHFCRNLFGELPAIQDVTVAILVTEDGGEHYRINVDITYTTGPGRFLVSTASNPVHIEALLATGIISETFTVDSLSDPVPAVIKRITGNQKNGYKSVSDLNFYEIAGRAKRSLFRQTPLRIPLESFRVYEAKNATDQGKTIINDCIYRISYSHKQRRSLPYTFWVNDRVAHIRAIDIDIHQLGPFACKRAQIHRFLASSQWSSEISLDTGRCHLPLDTWLVSGDGIVLIWSDNVDVQDTRTSE